MSFKLFKQKKIKVVIVLAVFLFISIQFIVPEKNISNIPSGKNFADGFKVDVNVYGLLSVSCFDCHSNNTRYPWYANIQPIGWFMADHINDGKRKLNFDSLTTYGKRKIASKFTQIVKEIKKGDMPLNSYVIIRQNANLNESDKQVLIDFFNSRLND